MENTVKRWQLRSLVKRVLRRAVSDGALNRINHTYLHLKSGLIPPVLNLRHPRGYNEKIIFLKLNYRHPNAHVYADKAAVRELVREVAGEKYLIPQLGVYDRAAEIDFTTFPDKFIVKATHGSGWNILCRDKASFDAEASRAKLQQWLNTNYYYYSAGREYQYKDIKPRIVAEQLLQAEDGGEPKDYKIFCFNGEPKFIQVDLDRHTVHKRVFFDLSWARLPFTILYPPYDGSVPPPSSLQEMLTLARKLSKGFPLIRVDLYDVAGHPYFGELTFHPDSGFGPIQPRQFDRILGDYIPMPSR